MSIAGNRSDGRGVLPDFEVRQTVDDIAQGRDVVMQFALDLIKKDLGD
jgi:hypothetical protein